MEPKRYATREAVARLEQEVADELRRQWFAFLTGQWAKVVSIEKDSVTRQGGCRP